MTARHQTLIAAALVLFGVACSDATAPIEVRATVVVPDTLVASNMAASTTQWIRFTLPVSIRNTSSVPLTFSYCSSGIQTQNGETWTSVWSPYCLLASGSASPIPPGDTRVLTMDVTAAVAGNGGPMWDNATVSGKYRLIVGLVPDGFSGIIPTIGSNAFILKQAP